MDRTGAGYPQVVPDEPTTQELRVEQIERERLEHARAQDATTDAGRSAAERRADKAAYLRARLDEQEAPDPAAPPHPGARHP